MAFVGLGAFGDTLHIYSIDAHWVVESIFSGLILEILQRLVRNNFNSTSYRLTFLLFKRARKGWLENQKILVLKYRWPRTRVGAMKCDAHCGPGHQ